MINRPTLPHVSNFRLFLASIRGWTSASDGRCGTASGTMNLHLHIRAGEPDRNNSLHILNNWYTCPDLPSSTRCTRVMVASSPKHQDCAFPPELVALGGNLQNAFRTSGNLPEAINAFCAVAFTRRDLALAGASFLVATFVKDLKRLGDQVGCRNLADELSAGSSVLCSLVSAYWDRKGQTEQLAGLADEILSRGQAAIPSDSEAAEFIAALAASLAIPHPDRAERLLNFIDGSLFSSEQHTLFQEVQEWQMAGQLLSNSSESERAFWQQELRRRRRAWFWDTEEGRGALRKLESLNPRLASGGSLIHRVVPQWAWDHQDDNEVAVTEPELPEDHPSELTAAPQIAAQQARVLPSTPSRFGTLPAVMFIAGGLLLLALGFWPLRKDAESTRAHTADAAVVRYGESSAPLELAAQSETAPTTFVELGSQAQGAGQPDPESGETAARAAQLLPVEMSARIGWVKSPLGLEFQVTETNSVSGRIIDPNGMMWLMPPDPSLPADIVGDREVLNPYSGEKTSLTNEQWKSGRAIAWGDTGWSFKLPDVLPSSLDESRNATAFTDEESGTDASPPARQVPKKSSTPASTATKQTRKPAANSIAASKSAVAPETDDTAYHGRKLHADYTQPSRSSIKLAPAPQTTGRSFVTRANNIRMTYKQGYWESRPGAYLSGAGDTPEKWARDMTLRERSSGTIPSGYAFEVVDAGIVRIVPVSSQQ